MLTLYDFLPSGNGYKVRLMLSQLGRPFQLVEFDILKGETRTPEYLAKNPDGRIPLLEFEDGRRLAQSNAILFHLAEGTPFLPADPWERALVLQWLFFEQYSHEPNVATVRFWVHELDRGADEAWAERIAEKREKGYAALDVMERHLATHRFFVGERYSIADIALYAYTHVAPEGEFDLGRYPAIRAWLDRVADQPGHVLITQSDFG
jgi:glutathione S-transferase